MSSAARLALYYVMLYLGTGVSLPFIATYFRSRGLSGAQIGVILALPLLIRPFTGPALAVWADGFSLRRTPLALLGLGTAVCYVLMARASDFPGLLLGWLCAATLLATLSPLIDVVALRRARIEGFNYGLPRGSGSSAFILANLIMGALLARTGPDVIVVWITAVTLVGALAACVVVPPERVNTDGAPSDRSTRWKGLGALLRNRPFLLAVTTAGLIQGGHAFYYGFSALVWRQQGIGAPMVGVLWGVGVAFEVGFMWFLEPWRRRLGPEWLLILGALGAMIRWTAFAFSPPLWLLFALQGLHAFSFAASFMASLPLIERLTPASSASAAQVINSALSMGFMLGVATLASGPLFDAFGARGYLAMSLMAALGLVGAVKLMRLTPPQIS